MSGGQLEQGLDAVDRMQLEVAIDAAGKRAKSTMSLDGLIGEWRLFANDVRRGYKGGIYEYWNSASIRGLIEEVAGALSEVGQTYVLSRVEEADRIFMDATSPDANLGHFWKTRLPKLRVGELLEDIGPAEE
jgi:hypothetical protein